MPDGSLPQIGGDPTVAPLAFDSFASRDAILVAAARQHDDALEIHSWVGGSVKAKVERFSDLIGVALDEPDSPLLARSPTEIYVLAERRAPDAPPNPRDRVWREEQDPSRHDAMVILRRDGAAWARTVIDASAAYGMALARDEGLWLLPVDHVDRPASILRVHRSGAQERYELPEALIAHQSTEVQPLSLFANADGSLLMLGGWGQGLHATTGLFKVRIRAASGGK